jgi:hypothetical protein
MEVSSEFGAEVEEQCVTLERLALSKEDTVQLPGGLIAFERSDRFCPYCDLKSS